MTLYERVLKLCRERGIEISNLGKEAGITVDKSTISRWKTGSVPRNETIRAIADFFNVTVNYLMGEEESEEPSFYNKVDLLCRERGISISRIGEIIPGLNVTGGSVSGWKKGAVPRNDKVRAIADYFDVTVDYLMGTEEEAGVQMEKPNSSPYGYKSGLLPVIGVASAGKGVFAEQDIIEWMEAPSDCCNEEHFWVRIVGASMEPDIFNGDYVLIRRQEELDNGNIGLFVVADEGFCKRYRHEEGVTELISSNPSFPPMRFVNGRQNIVRIIGRVIRLNRTL